MKIYINIFLLFGFFWSFSLFGQVDRWQQHAIYKMEIDFDHKKHRFAGKQQITYTNNSPDQLNRVFYHLYFNAFQPNSMMDVRSRTIADADPRVRDRISQLNENEIGYQKVHSLKQNGKSVQFEEVGTILEVKLNEPINPGETVELEMEFEAQVPVQIRRSGRDNSEGVDYSMAQWYPKLCEYDYQGWHANPYVGREFHGVWGDFDVEISIDKDFVVAGSGLLVNAEDIGKGYFDRKKKPKSKKGKIIWHYLAENVHDFAWAADTDFKVVSKTMYDGTLVYFVYIPSEKTNENWEKLPDIMDEALRFMNDNYGKYPYPVYAFIQGGDGGMEYPMATLITGERSLGSLVGVSVHEWMHSWYQMVLATNESLFAWMDEGFTSFASAEVMNHLKKKGMIPGEVEDDPHIRTVGGFVRFAASGNDEPLSIHADHFSTNQAYGVGAYVKGAVCLSQLEYILGSETFRKALKDYYNTWKFKHPNANDFFRIMEKNSGLELDWFKEYFVNTRHIPEYAIESVDQSGTKAIISLTKKDQMPMPLDLTVVFDNEEVKHYYIPMRILRGNKSFDKKVTVLEDWPWTHPLYEFNIDLDGNKIKSLEIDPTKRMMDKDYSDNIWSNE